MAASCSRVTLPLGFEPSETPFSRAHAMPLSYQFNGSVTREQLAAMLYRYAGSPAVSGSLPFSDAGSVSDYAQNALIWATQNGILNGYADGRVVPAANSQRSQVAAMMARFIQNAQ